MDFETLRELSPRQLIRAAIRKFLFRLDRIGFYVVDASTLGPVDIADVVTSVIPGREAQFSQLSNPYLKHQDFEHLRDHPESWCVIARSGERTVASNWYLRGTLHLTEISRTIQLPLGAHYSCRTFVEPDFRGRRLKGHMDLKYTQAVGDCACLTGAIYDWNTSSIRAVLNGGWQRTGTLWSCRILGIAFGNQPLLASAEVISP